MSYQRYQRVSSLIQEELNKIILREIEFPEGVLVTVTAVQVQKDLNYAIVNFSVIPTNKSEKIRQILDKNQKRLRHFLYKKIRIKPMPEIQFRIDLGLEKAAETERVFLKIEKGKE